MKLTTKVRYGLRAVIEIAQKAKEEPLNITDMANSQGISIKYLEAILVKLRDSGIIKSVRGKKGGIFISKNA